jgi:hypothetical protein
MLVNGNEFFTLTQVAKAAGVTRQTLWRWRVELRVPQGRRYRDRIVLYTAAEQADVCRFASRMNSLDDGDRDAALQEL